MRDAAISQYPEHHGGRRSQRRSRPRRIVADLTADRILMLCCCGHVTVGSSHVHRLSCRHRPFHRGLPVHFDRVAVRDGGLVPPGGHALCCGIIEIGVTAPCRDRDIFRDAVRADPKRKRSLPLLTARAAGGYHCSPQAWRVPVDVGGAGAEPCGAFWGPANAPEIDKKLMAAANVRRMNPDCIDQSQGRPGS